MEKIITAVDRIDAKNAADFERDLLNCAEEVDTLIVDMQATKYVSSVCLRALLKAHKKMRSKQGEFILRNVNPPIMEILEVTGFAGNFNIE